MLLYLLSAVIVAAIGGAFTFWVVKQNSDPKVKIKPHHHVHSH